MRMNGTRRFLTMTAIACASVLGPEAIGQPGLCSAVATRSLQQSDGAIASSYPATAILDVDILALFTNAQAKQMSGDHVVEFRIFTPKGHLYQSISVPFSADEKLRGKKTKVKGYPREIATSVLESVRLDNRTYYAVAARLPVAGTAIITNSLYGSWTAEALIDGAPLSCNDKVRFEIRQ